MAELTSSRLAERVPDLPPPDADASAQGNNVFATVLRRWPLMLLGIILGLIGGFGWYLTAEPVYESKAQILIIKRDIGLLVESSRLSYVEDYVSTQQTLIKSKKVMRAAAIKLKNIRLNRALPDDDSVTTEQLITNVGVIRDRDASTGVVGSNILNMTYRGMDPTDTKRILDNIIAAYQEELKTVYDERSDQDIKTISKIIDSEQKSFDVNTAKLKEFNQELMKISNEDPNELRIRLSQRLLRYEQLNDVQKNLANNIAEMEKFANSDDVVRQEVLRNVVSGLRSLNGSGQIPLDDQPLNLNNTQMAILQLRVEIQKLRQRYGEGHSLLQEKLGTLNTLEQINGEKATAGAAGNAPGAPASTYDQLKGKLIFEKGKIEKLVAELKGETESMRKTLSSMNGLVHDIQQLQKNLERIDRDLQISKERKSKLEATRNQGGFQASPISEPSDGSKIAPRLFQSLLIFGFLGTLAGLGLALAFEFTDKSFRSPAEIRRRLGLPVVGHIPPIRVDMPADNPALKGREVNMEPTIVTHLRPKSIEAEAYRGVRTQLYFSTQGVGHQVIQVTSPNPGDGKSTLAANLAVSIAQSGKRVILVDCDFRKPRVHKIFHLEKPEVGLASAIDGNCTLGEAIRVSEIDNLSLLPCGPRPQNPAELLTSPEFQTLLDQLRAQYDFVIIDTPPVLAVSDPAVVAPRVDGVLLVFRMTKKARPTAERAREQLAALGANVVGVIVNGTGGSKDEGYGYGYGYNYGYGYQYQYQYEYEYADNYTDDHTDSPSSYGDMKRPELPPARE
jgi:capsular exopolysaccharide synthesis family protein